MANKTVAQRVAWNLRRIRTERGLSQEALALNANVDRSYVGRLERGEENPTITILDRLASALGVAADELLARTQGPKPRPLPGGRKKKTVD
jgi:transcriptional regulator with XRE-family HTH domain